MATIASVGSVTAATGASWQKHLLHDGSRWWLFYIDDTNANQIKALYSADMSTWSAPTNATFTLPYAHAADGRSFAMCSKVIDGTTVVWLAIITKNSSTQTPYKVRLTLSGTTITWGSAAAWGGALTTSTYMPDALGVVIGSDDHVYIFSNHAHSGGGNCEAHYSTDADTGSAGPSTWTDSELGTVGQYCNASTGVALADGKILAVFENGAGTEPNTLTNPKSFVWSGSAWGTVINTLASAVTAESPNNYGLVARTATDVHLVVRSGSDAYVHVRFNGTNWTTLSGAAIPTQASIEGGGIFLATDGTNVWLTVLSSADGNPVRQVVWNGTEWEDWADVEDSSGTRGYVSGCPTVVGGNVGMVWFEPNDIIGILNDPITPAEVLTVAERYVMPSASGGTATFHLVRINGEPWTGSETITLSGVTGWAYSSKTFVDNSHYTVIATCPTSGDVFGDLSISDGVATVVVPVGVATANMLADWDASTGKTVSGGRISSWVDRFASIAATQATGGLQPFAVNDIAGDAVVAMPNMDPTTGPPTTVSNGTTLTIANDLSVDYGNCAVIAVWDQGMYSGAFASIFTDGAGHDLLKTNHVVRCIGTNSTLVVPRGPAVVGVSMAAGVPTVYNGVDSETLSVYGTGTSTGGVIGGTGSSRAIGQLKRLMVFNALSSSTIADVIAYLKARYEIEDTFDNQIVYEGDSYGGHNASYNNTLMGQFAPRVAPLGWRVCDFWTDSYKISDISARAATVDALIDEAFDQNVLVVLIGDNDLIFGDEPSVVYGHLVTYVAARVAAGWEVWVCTDIQGDTTEANINAYNDLIDGTSGDGIIVDGGATKVIDFAATRLGTLPVDEDLYSSASGHPTDAGYDVLADKLFEEFAVAPTVTTSATISTGSTTVTVGGTTTDDGGGTVTEQGVAYGTSADPVIAGTHVVDEATSGAFTVNLTGLKPLTTYHFRAYATNEAGTSYGVDRTFTMLNIYADYAPDNVYYGTGGSDSGVDRVAPGLASMDLGCSASEVVFNAADGAMWIDVSSLDYTWPEIGDVLYLEYLNAEEDDWAGQFTVVALVDEDWYLEPLYTSIGTIPTTAQVSMTAISDGPMATLAGGQALYGLGPKYYNIDDAQADQVTSTKSNFVGLMCSDAEAEGTAVTPTGHDVDGELIGGYTAGVHELIGKNHLYHLDGSTQYVRWPVPTRHKWSSTMANLWTRDAGNPVIDAAGNRQFGQLAENPAGGYYWFGSNGSGAYRMDSTDLVTWSNLTSMLAGGGDDAWDKEVQVVSAFRVSGDNWCMFYRGKNTAGTLKIGKATSSDGGDTWTRITNGSTPGLLDQFGTYYDPVGIILVGSTYYMYCNGTVGGVSHGALGVFTSTDLTTWTASVENPFLSDLRGVSGSGHFCPGVFLLGGYYWLVCPFDWSSTLAAGEHAIVMYRSTDPTFPVSNRSFMGYAIINSEDAEEAGYLDTPSVATTSIQRILSGDFDGSIKMLYTGHTAADHRSQCLAAIAASTLGGAIPCLRSLFDEEMTYTWRAQWDTAGLADGKTLFSIGNSLTDGTPHLLCKVHKPAATAYLKFYISGAYAISDAAIVANTPYHFALTHEWANGAWVNRLYVNGVDTEWTYSPYFRANQNYIYLGAGYNNSFHDGYIGEFKMFPWALSGSEINRDYRGAAARFMGGGLAGAGAILGG